MSCASTVALCSGQVAQFSIIGTGLSSVTPFTIAIDGTLSGTATGAGTIVTTFLPGGVSFTIPAGAFNKTIGSASLPATNDGTFNVSGSLALSLAGGQTLTLPNSLAFTVGSPSNAVPEPGTMGLLGASLAGVLFAVRRRRA